TSHRERSLSALARRHGISLAAVKYGICPEGNLSTRFPHLGAYRSWRRRLARDGARLSCPSAYRDRRQTVLCQMIFGDMHFADAARSIRIFGREIIPAFF